jgi:hypothetical protein
MEAAAVVRVVSADVMVTSFPKVRPHGRVDKSVLTIAEPQRVRDAAHLAFIRGLPCSIPGCRRGMIEAHHLTCAPVAKARGLKVGDDWTVPLCAGPSGHHTGVGSVHRHGNERVWWQSWGIDPISLARSLWTRRAI